MNKAFKSKKSPINHLHQQGYLFTRLFYLLSLLGLFALPNIAQAGDITGTVIDANTGSFLPGASVRIVDLGRTATTDRSGEFRLANVPGGSYTLRVRFIGYDAVTETVQVPETGSISPRIEVGSEITELEGFTVEGMREGRSRALQQKKTLINITDIISADSIGNLPDQNVAEALVRLPGVSLDLSQGEGRFVSIRGVEPNLNNVTINGASASNPGVEGRQGRSMPLDVIGSSQVSQLEVIKSVTPDMDAQGLGGTVNIITPSGYDKEKTFAYGKFEVGYNDVSEDQQYAIQGTYGTTFGADRKFAMAVSASYEWRPYRNEKIETRWSEVTDEISGNDFLVLSDLEINPDEGNRRRYGFNGKFEYRPDSDTELFLNVIFNRFTDWRTSVEDKLEPDGDVYCVNADCSQGFWGETGAAEVRLNRARTDQDLINATFGGKKTWGNLTVSSELTYSFAREEDPYNNWTQFRGRGRGNQFRFRDGVDTPYSDINGVAIPSELGDNGTINQDGGGLPVYFDLTNFEPVFTTGRDDDTTRFEHRRNRVENSLSEETSYIPRVDVQWDTDNFLGTGHTGFFKAGFKYLNRDRFVNDNSFRPVDNDLILSDNPAFVGPGQAILSYNTGFDLQWDPLFNDHFGGPGTPEELRQRLSPISGNPFEVDEVESVENSLEDDYDITEKITAFYLMGNIEIGEKLTITGGFRFEKTDVDLSANQFNSIGDIPESNLDLSGCTESLDGEFCVQKTSNTFDYNNWLPNIQARYEFSENLVLRAAITSTIGRPAFEDAAPISQFEAEDPVFDAGNTSGVPDEWERFTIRLRNPNLQPYESTNFDVSLEYYLPSGGLLAIAFFHKEVDNPIFEFSFDLRDFDFDGDGVTTENITVSEMEAEFLRITGSTISKLGIEDNQRIDRLRLRRGEENASSGTITGVELTAQIPFTFLPEPLDGFGVDANLSFIDSSVDLTGTSVLQFQPDRENLDFPFFRQPDLIGNVSLWYQKGRLSGRVAVRFQDSQWDELTEGPLVDVWVAEQTFWDAQIAYRFTDNWTVYANFQNFTHETDDQIAGDNSSLLREREDFGATFRFGLRWNY